MIEGDAQLLARAVAGDGAAREALCTRYYLPVLRFFELNATWVAEDLTQRTFVACLEKLSTVPANAFRPYLFGIARNQLRLYVRAAMTRMAHDEPDAEVKHTGVSTIVARSQQQRRLLVALGKLSEEERIAITLHYWEELSSAELGQVLNIPASTVRTRLMRARERIRAELERQGERNPQVETVLRNLGPRLDRT